MTARVDAPLSVVSRWKLAPSLCSTAPRALEMLILLAAHLLREVGADYPWRAVRRWWKCACAHNFASNVGRRESPSGPAIYGALAVPRKNTTGAKRALSSVDTRPPRRHPLATCGVSTVLDTGRLLCFRSSHAIGADDLGMGHRPAAFGTDRAHARVPVRQVLRWCNRGAATLPEGHHRIMFCIRRLAVTAWSRIRIVVVSEHVNTVWCPTPPSNSTPVALRRAPRSASACGGIGPPACRQRTIASSIVPSGRRLRAASLIGRSCFAGEGDQP